MFFATANLPGNFWVGTPQKWTGVELVRLLALGRLALGRLVLEQFVARGKILVKFLGSSR